MTMVKMCGLRTVGDISYVNEAGPDMAGMIMVPGFRRTVTEDGARAMLSHLSASIRSVGVFMDQPEEDVINISSRLGFDVIQLHGGEDDGYVRRVRDALEVPVIKRFGASADQLAAAEGSSADMVLIDPGSGSGETFDLSVLGGLGRKVIIAGGLTPDNVADAIRKVRPYGVDTSSGIETGGSKDRDKMIRFISAVKAEDNQREETI